MTITDRLNKILPIVYVAIASFGITISVAGYGLFVLLLLVLVMQTILDIAKKRTRQIQVFDIKLYIVYIVLFYICSFFNGDGDFGRNSLIISYLVCVLIYFAISKGIKTQCEINNILDVFLVLLIADCIITILQYNNSSLGWSVWYFFNDATTVKQAGMIEGMESGSQVLGKNYLFCPGIFPSQVYNGCIVGSLSVIALYKLYSARTWLYKLFYVLLLLIIIYSMVVIQQRMAFFLFIIAFATILYTKDKLLIISVVILLLLIYLLTGLEFGEEQLGRLVDMEDKNRQHLYSEGFDYIFSHLWVGGRQEFRAINRLSVHNVFLNAFMYGGIFGAAMIITIYMRMCVYSIKLIIKSLKVGINESVILAYALLIYNIISLTHNNSLLTGDPIIWVLYGLMLLSLKFEKNERRA